MTTIMPVGAPAPMPVGSAESGQDLPGLPAPLSLAMEPGDALAMMLAAMERMSQMSLSHSEKRLRFTSELMRERLEEFLQKVQAALEAARRAAEKQQDDDGGWFDDLVDTVSDVVGDVVGTVIDFAKDAVEAPIDVAEGIVKNIDDPGAMLQMIKAELLDLASNGETAESVKGFTKGVVTVAAKLSEFTAKFALALAEHGFDQRAAWNAVAADAKELWESFQENILDNPDFFEVAGMLAKVAAVGAAVMSGGTLAWVAVAVFAVCEADNRYGFIEKAVGKDAAPWVRLGLQIAASALLMAAAGDGDAAQILKYLKGGTAVLAGASQISQGLRGLDEADRHADALEREADVKDVVNRLHRLQRLMDDLVELIEEQTENRKIFFSMGNELVQTQAAMHEAAIVRA